MSLFLLVAAWFAVGFLLAWMFGRAVHIGR